MVSATHRNHISLFYQILFAALIGLVIGLVFGDKAAILGPIGKIYTMLMEAVVFPYIICTLLTSLGDLSPKLSLRLLKKGWLFYLFLLLLTFGTMILLSQSLPLNITFLASSSTLIPQNDRILNLLIPENIFSALSNNYIPAVVVFCILFGLTLQLIPNKTTLFRALNTISEACLLFWRGLIKLAPIATLALIANLSGTMRLSQLHDLSEFLLIYTAAALILIFWLLPIAISAFTGITYKKILYELRTALIISAVTTLSVVALPYVQEVTNQLLSHKKSHLDKTEKLDIIKTILLVGYPLAQLGNFFVYQFILFASLYFNQPLNSYQYGLLPILSFLSSAGSPTASINAINFLATWLHFPSETISLYVSLTPLIRYGQVLVSVMGFAFLTILISFAFFDCLTINYKKLFSHLILALGVLLSITGLLRYSFPNPNEKLYDRLNQATLSNTLTQSIKATILPPFDESKTMPDAHHEDTFVRIQRTGILRVGFNADMRPFAFYNAQHQLVGYDIAYAYALATTLNSRIEFVPFTWPYLIKDLQANKFDIAMSAIYVTDQRLADALFTQPYFRSPISLIVPKDQEALFQSVNKINQLKNLKIGAFNDPILVPIIKTNFPTAHITILPTASNDIPLIAFREKQMNALLWSQAQTHVWVLAHPGYTSMTPVGLPAPFLMAYMVNTDSPQFLGFLNYWLELKRNEGFQQQMYRQWILIRPTSDEGPRWSLLQVLLNHHT